MKCPRCNSTRVILFIDGFGSRRIFCKDCFLSVDEKVFKKLMSQKTLLEFDLNRYIKGFEAWMKLQ